MGSEGEQCQMAAQEEEAGNGKRCKQQQRAGSWWSLCADQQWGNQSGDGTHAFSRACLKILTCRNVALVG